MPTLVKQRNRVATQFCERLLERYFLRRNAMSPAKRVRFLRQVALALRHRWTRPEQIHQYFYEDRHDETNRAAA